MSENPQNETVQTLVQLSHAKKSFGNTKVLKDISLSVNKGEVLSIIGPSGGGKSTLLRCCTLLETLDSGSLSFGDIQVAQDKDGKSVYASKDTLRAARQKFGLVFQNFNLFPHYTVMKNIVDAPINVQKVPKEQAYETARALLEKMGLSGKENMVPCELSGGQQQRVAIARALALNPDVLFIVTHEMAFARDVADTAVFMDGGVIVEQGPAAEVIGNPQHERTKAFLRGDSQAE